MDNKVKFTDLIKLRVAVEVNSQEELDQLAKGMEYFKGMCVVYEDHRVDYNYEGWCIENHIPIIQFDQIQFSYSTEKVFNVVPIYKAVQFDGRNQAQVAVLTDTRVVGPFDEEANKGEYIDIEYKDGEHACSAGVGDWIILLGGIVKKYSESDYKKYFKEI